MPDNVKTSKLMRIGVHTNAGLERAKDPGAGAISHYYGIWSQAIRDVEAGAELSKYMLHTDVVFLVRRTPLT
jgi:hypothetical protein